MTEQTFIVPGPPQAKERPRYSSKSGTWYTPRRTKDYEELVAQYAMVAGLKLEKGKFYGLRLEFYLSSFRSDLDNCWKAIQDGIQVYGKKFGWNDKQVVHMVAPVVMVHDASEEQVVVTISERPEPRPRTTNEGSDE